MGLGSSLQPVSRCKRGLQGIAAVLVSTEKPSLTGTSAQGAWMHQSHQAQSGSKQRVLLPAQQLVKRGKENIREGRTGEGRTGKHLPKNIKHSGHKETGQRKDMARQRRPEGREQQDAAPVSPLLSSLPTPRRLRSPATAPHHWAARPRGPGDWLQHSTVAPAASALHALSMGRGAPGGSLGAS